MTFPLTVATLSLPPPTSHRADSPDLSSLSHPTTDRGDGDETDHLHTRSTMTT